MGSNPVSKSVKLEKGKAKAKDISGLFSLILAIYFSRIVLAEGEEADHDGEGGGDGEEDDGDAHQRLAGK